MKYSAIIFVLLISACSQSSSEQEVVTLDADAGVAEQYPCNDSCGEGKVFICETGHFEFAHDTQVCTNIEYGDTYIEGSYGYCGLCDFDMCETGTACQDGNINGFIVCRDMFGDEGGPYEVCTDDPMINGDQCGHCPGSEEPEPQCEITCGSIDCPDNMLCNSDGCCEAPDVFCDTGEVCDDSNPCSDGYCDADGCCNPIPTGEYIP